MSSNRDNKMGKWGATSYIIGNIVGSGIFITPTTIINSTQSVGTALIIWALSALIAAMGAYCYIELGTSIRSSGGDFAYLCYVKWRSIAFVFMTGGCLLTFPLTVSIQAETFSEYIIRGFNIDFNCDENSEWKYFFLRKLIGFALTWFLLYINFFSLKKFVSRFQIVATTAKVLSLGIIILAGFYFLIIKGKTENIEHLFDNTTLNVGQLSNAFFSGLFSYDGWDILNFGAEDLSNPKSTMCFAIVVGILSVALLYISTNLSYFVVLTVPEIQDSIAVATTFAKHTLGNFHYAMPFLVSIVLVGSLNSSLFAASRYMVAASREHQLPTMFSCMNLKYDSPRTALFFHVLLAMLFSFLGNVEELINYVAFAMWMQRSFTLSALLYIRYFHIPVHPEAIRTSIVFPILFLAISLALVITTIAQNFKSSQVGLVMLAINLVFYTLFLSERAPFQRLRCYRNMIAKLDHWSCVFAQFAFNGVIDVKNRAELTEIEPLRSGEERSVREE